MYQSRREKLLKLLKKDELDAFLVCDPLNIFYLTGFTGGDSWLLLSKNRSALISDPRYDLTITEEAPDVERVIRGPGTSMVDVVKRMTDTSMMVGVEAESMSIGEFSRLAMQTTCQWSPTSQLVESLREIKDKREIAAIREAVRIAINGFEVLRLTLNSEMTEVDVRNELEYQMRRIGAQDCAFPTIAAIGPRSAIPHAVPSSKNVIRSGGLLLVDWGAKKNMYLSDLTRVLITTKNPTSFVRKIYNTVLDAQRTAFDMIRPGITGSEVDAAARAVIDRAGYGAMFNHGLGHGIGLFVHERGGLSRSSDKVLKKGMVVTVEPGIYLPGRFGVRIEDDVLLTDDGIEILSKRLAKDFDEVIVRC